MFDLSAERMGVPWNLLRGFLKGLLSKQIGYRRDQELVAPYAVFRKAQKISAQ